MNIKHNKIQKLTRKRHADVNSSNGDKHELVAVVIPNPSYYSFVLYFHDKPFLFFTFQINNTLFHIFNNIT